LADFEQQCASIYAYDDHRVWQRAHAEAEAVVATARKAIAERCQELGIPREFAPSIVFGWAGRGRNAIAERRIELRKVAERRIQAIEKEACTRIERHCYEASEQILMHGLTSAAAREFVAKMPPLDVAQVEKMLDAKAMEWSPRYRYERPSLMPAPSEDE
jgi:hypothetical protein